MTGRRFARQVDAPLLSLIFVALTLGLTFAHVLEIIGKLRLGARDWLTVQQNLYVAFGPIGGACEILAIAFTWLTVLSRASGSGEARYSWIAAIAASVGLGVWAVVVAPMNAVLSSWTPDSLRSDWTLVRDRWELGHAAQFVLYAIAFIALARKRAGQDPTSSAGARPVAGATGILGSQVVRKPKR
jgi:hypothetical protein